MPFVELSALTNFTFLTGASHPEEMILRAAEMGMAAIAVADVNSVAGIVRAHTKARELARDGRAEGAADPGGAGDPGGRVSGHLPAARPGGLGAAVAAC